MALLIWNPGYCRLNILLENTHDLVHRRSVSYKTDSNDYDRLQIQKMVQNLQLISVVHLASISSTNLPIHVWSLSSYVPATFSNFAIR